MQKNKHKIKIVLTGGHAATTALATIQSLTKNEKTADCDMHWIGAKSTIEGKKIAGIETSVFPSLGVHMHVVAAGKLQRKFSIRMVLALLRVPLGFFAAYRLLLKIKPQVVVSFGGSVGLPVVCAAWFLRIPSILHEQTVAAGLANRLSSYFVNKVALARDESQRFFPKNKSMVVGNPIMEQIVKVGVKKKRSKVPVLFITCGSRGSQLINKAVEQILPELLKNYIVIHQTGELDKKHFDDLLQNNYEVYATIPPLDIAKMYKRADVVVARAGANTVSELVALRIPCVLIPIPWVQHNEQGKNAQMAKKLGIATIIPQDDLTPVVLLQKIEERFQNWKSIVSSVHQDPSINDTNAADRFVELIQEYL